MENVEFVKGKMTVELEGDYYHVHVLPLDLEKVEKEEAYIYGDIVLPYRGEIDYPGKADEMEPIELDEYDSIHMSKPGFYKMVTPRGTVLLMTEPENTEDYSIDKVIILDIKKLVDRISSEDFLSPEDIEKINVSSDFREYPISPDDDFLKVLVKTVINTKKLNLKVFSNRLPKRHTLGNMVHILNSDTRMSIKYFMIWKELLEFDFDINLYDDSVSLVPMNKVITYESTSGEVTVND